MKKILACLFTWIIIVGFTIQPLPIVAHRTLAEHAPAYAKWGEIAMKTVKEKYPHAEIIDYLHIGRDSGKLTSTEKFKLWLINQDKEFGVLIDIKFDTKTEQIMEIQFKEISK